LSESIHFFGFQAWQLAITIGLPGFRLFYVFYGKFIPSFLINKISILLKHFLLSVACCGVLVGLLPALSHADTPVERPAQSAAENFGVDVKNVQINSQGNDYLMSADIVYRLSENALEALQNGVPLFWDVQIKTLQQRDYGWDKVLANNSIRYRIQYHALLNMYRVKKEGGELSNFSTLPMALDAMSAIRDFRVMEQALYRQGKHYIVGIKVTLDRGALPLPLRPMAYVNPQWYLSSNWTLWPLTK
jgi:hypothetical protein